MYAGAKRLGRRRPRNPGREQGAAARAGGLEIVHEPLKFLYGQSQAADLLEEVLGDDAKPRRIRIAQPRFAPFRARILFAETVEQTGAGLLAFVAFQKVADGSGLGGGRLAVLVALGAVTGAGRGRLARGLVVNATPSPPDLLAQIDTDCWNLATWWLHEDVLKEMRLLCFA